MKLEDLSIGNYVRYNGEILQVGMLSVYDVFCDLYRKSEDEPAAQVFSDEMKDVKGIEITEEILQKSGFERNGFEHTGQIHVLSDDYYNVIVFELSDGIWAVIYHNCEMDLPDQTMHISYVHEFQNFLRMVGVEKDIEL